VLRVLSGDFRVKTFWPPVIAGMGGMQKKAAQYPRSCAVTRNDPQNKFAASLAHIPRRLIAGLDLDQFAEADHRVTESFIRSNLLF
jgi:hypothetical protein